MLLEGKGALKGKSVLLEGRGALKGKSALLEGMGCSKREVALLEGEGLSYRRQGRIWVLIQVHPRFMTGLHIEAT